ncbi:phosphopantothenoylcysteine decarboxylase [Malassezia caprae]|uniref:Phosphopantothenoylcysteine decarboxylase n=1 Tax=Malassezia caprae TaxID=1381934 RepID=A0AAF0IX43_9BASI|nr:phosphopantothenoylcysteine decarboxylase [Malassezia caprae]
MSVPTSLSSRYPALPRPPTAARPLHVVLACTGSVASVKVPDIVTGLLAYPHIHVHVVASAAALHFFDAGAVEALDTRASSFGVRELAAMNCAAGEPADRAQAVTAPRAKVWRDADEWAAWTKVGDPVLHIELRRWADVVLVAPCSADTLAKIAHGLCDNLLLSFLRALSPGTPTWVYPAMNTLMYLHPLTAQHASSLEALGYEVHGPIAKRLACGDLGMGAMLEWADIVRMVAERYGVV